MWLSLNFWLSCKSVEINGTIFDHELRREVLKVTLLFRMFRQFTFLAAGPLGGARGQAPNAIWAFLYHLLSKLPLLYVNFS